MKLYLGNNFSNRMVKFFKRSLLAFAFLLAANLKAIEEKNGHLPEFNGISALVLKEGVSIHPSHLLVRLENKNDIHDLYIHSTTDMHYSLSGSHTRHFSICSSCRGILYRYHCDDISITQTVV